MHLVLGQTAPHHKATFLQDEIHPANKELKTAKGGLQQRSPNILLKHNMTTEPRIQLRDTQKGKMRLQNQIPQTRLHKDSSLHQ